MTLLDTHIVLLGSCGRYSAEIQQHLGSQVTHHSQKALPKRGIASAPHSLYIAELSELLAVAAEDRLAVVADGVFHGRNLLLLHQGRLLNSLPVQLEDSISEVLSELFLYRKIKHRNPAIRQLWQNLMSEPVLLNCQRICSQVPHPSQPRSLDELSCLISPNLHFILETQELLKGLLHQFAHHKVVSWEARNLLDTANALLMANSYLATEKPPISAEDAQDYLLLVQQTLYNFGEQLSAAMFRYNEKQAFYWFFTGQKIQLQETQSLVG